MGDQVIKREIYMEKIRPFMNKDIVKVLTGIRRCGKSVLLELIKEELIDSGVDSNKVITYNLESFQNIELKNTKSLYNEISNHINSKNEKYYIFLDEIQEVDEWELCVNSLRVDFNVDIYITGSNAHLLSGELATHLAGRYVEIQIYPLSFKEFMILQDNLAISTSVNDAFAKFLELGGMPFLGVLGMEKESSLLYLEDVYRSVLLKDVIERNNIRDVELLERILIYIISNIGRTFSSKSISDYLKSENRKIASETVYNYIKACEDACLLHKVKRQDLVGKKILKVHEKIFITDHGFRQAIYGKNNQNIDQVLENIVYIELLRRGYKVSIGKLYDREVDFIGEKSDEKIYIQVTYLLASEEVVEREFGVLENIKDNYPKYVLSMDEFSFGRSGIIHMNIKDFLLME